MAASEGPVGGCRVAVKLPLKSPLKSRRQVSSSSSASSASSSASSAAVARQKVARRQFAYRAARGPPEVGGGGEDKLFQRHNCLAPGAGPPRGPPLSRTDSNWIKRPLAQQLDNCPSWGRHFEAACKSKPSSGSCPRPAGAELRPRSDGHLARLAGRRSAGRALIKLRPARSGPSRRAKVVELANRIEFNGLVNCPVGPLVVATTQPPGEISPHGSHEAEKYELGARRPPARLGSPRRARRAPLCASLIALRATL